MAAGIRILDVIVVLAGLVGLLLLGLRFSTSNRTTDDYFLGNRSMPGWLVGVSLVGTSISSITFLALPAAAYALDWRRIVNNLMLPVGIVMAVLVFIPLFRQGRITTAFEYLGTRFGPLLRLYGAASFIIVQLLRLSTVLYLASLPISLLLGIPVVSGIAFAVRAAREGLGVLLVEPTSQVGGMWTSGLQGFDTRYAGHRCPVPSELLGRVTNMWIRRIFPG